MVEHKLDGERQLVHCKGGIVTVHSRNSKWYSEIYSPIVGPYIRKVSFELKC